MASTSTPAVSSPQSTAPFDSKYDLASWTTSKLAEVLDHRVQLPVFTSSGLTTAAVQKLCTSLNSNPHAFDDWQELIGIVEPEGNPDEIESVYTELLKLFPLCWGYWTRLYKIRSSKHGPSASLSTFEEAVAVAGPCVDLWIAYCESACDALGDEESIRTIFERAVAAVGQDWHAGPLWLKYLEFEQSRKQWRRLGDLFCRALAAPTSGISEIRAKLHELPTSQDSPSPEELCMLDEVLELSTIGVENKIQEETHAEQREDNTKQDPAGDDATNGICDFGDSSLFAEFFEACREEAMSDAGSHGIEEGEVLEDGETSEPKASSDAEEGEIVEGQRQCDDSSDGEIVEETDTADANPPPSVTDKIGKNKKCDNLPEHIRILVEGKPVSEDVVPPTPVMDKQTKQQWEWLLQRRDALCMRTSSEVQHLSGFEAQLKRPWFENKPLIHDELDIWRSYLSYMERASPCDTAKLNIVYKRCLVATNNYMEFWLRYVSFLEKQGDIQAARGVMAEGVLSARLHKRVDAIVAWAELEERCGNTGSARKILDASLSSFAAGNAMMMLRRISVEHRAGNLQDAGRLFKTFIIQATNTHVRSFMTRQYAKFCENELRDIQAAMVAFDDAWSAGCKDSALLTEYTSLRVRCAAREQNTDGLNMADILQKNMGLFEDALNPKITSYTPAEARKVWTAYINVLVTYGAPIVKLREAQASSRRHFAQQRSLDLQTSQSKRKLADAVVFASSKAAKYLPPQILVSSPDIAASQAAVSCLAASGA